MFVRSKTEELVPNWYSQADETLKAKPASGHARVGERKESGLGRPFGKHVLTICVNTPLG